MRSGSKGIKQEKMEILRNSVYWSEQMLYTIYAICAIYPTVQKKSEPTEKQNLCVYNT